MVSGPSPAPREDPFRPPAIIEAHALPRLAAEAARDLRVQVVESRIVRYGHTLSALDLMVASLNGFSAEVNYIIPPRPVPLRECGAEMQALLRSGGAPEDCLVLHGARDAVFRLHCAQALLESGQVSSERASEALSMELMTVAPHAFTEYLDALQDTARLFARTPGKFMDRASDLVALSALQSIAGNSTVWGTLPPSLSILGGFRDGIVLRASVSNALILQRLAPGATVFIPGAGYNTLRMLPGLIQEERFRFVLNDRDPFVAAVLERVMARLEAPHLRFLGGEMHDAFGKLDRVDLVLAGNLYSSTPEAIAQFCTVAGTRLPHGTPVHVVQTSSSAPEVVSTAQTWSKALREAGFTLDEEVGSLISSDADVGPFPQSELLQMTGAHLEQVLMGGRSHQHARTYHSYVRAFSVLRDRAP